MGANLASFGTFWLVAGTLPIGWEGDVLSSGSLLCIVIKVCRCWGPMHQCLRAKRSLCTILDHAPYWATHQIGLRA